MESNLRRFINSAMIVSLYLLAIGPVFFRDRDSDFLFWCSEFHEIEPSIIGMFSQRSVVDCSSDGLVSKHSIDVRI
jgi:hypothetical protein